MRRFRIAWVLSAVIVATMLGPLIVRAEPLSPPVGDLPPNCGVGVLTPVKRAGLIVARGEAECSEPIPHFLLTVILSRKNLEEGVWRRVAAAIGQTPYATSYYLVKVAAPCKRGRYRTIEVVKYRFNTSDPWTLMIRWHSPTARIRLCPS
jgi:hypothetical protein